VKDALGKEIYIGDTAVTCHTKYQTLIIGTVVNFTPKMVVIDRKDRKGIARRAPGVIAIVDSFHTPHAGDELIKYADNKMVPGEKSPVSL